MCQDSIEDEEGDEGVTEVATEVVTEAEEDTVPTGATVDGMSLHDVVMRVLAD